MIQYGLSPDPLIKFVLKQYVADFLVELPTSSDSWYGGSKIWIRPNSQSSLVIWSSIVYPTIVKVIWETSLGDTWFFLSKINRFFLCTETSPECTLPSRV